MGCQDRSKRAQEPPRAAQYPLKTAQKPPKTFQRGPKSPQDRPKTPPRRPKTRPGALLGRSWRHLGTIKQQDRKQGRKLSIGGALLRRFWSPKCLPKRPQNDTKTSQKSRRKMHHFFIALGPVLDRSWSDLGPVLGSKKWFSPYVFQCFVKIDVFEKRPLQDAFLAQLDPIWAPKRRPKGAQDDPKTDPKRVQN